VSIVLEIVAPNIFSTIITNKSKEKFEVVTIIKKKPKK